MKRYLLAVFAAGTWMILSEAVRNELVIKQVWVEGFEGVGLTYPSEPLNVMVWGVWILIFVSLLPLIVTKFNTLTGTVIAWSLGFVLLWSAMWNLGVLPPGLLYWAVPWSFAEVYVAAWICRRIFRNSGQPQP